MPHADDRPLRPKQYHDVLERVQDGIIVTGSDGLVVYMNTAAKRLYGFEERAGAELESLNLQRYALANFEVRTLAGEPVADDDQPLVRALRGETYRDVELLVRYREQDDPRVFVFSGAPLEGERPLGVLIIRDETDRWRSERRYRVAFETDPAPSVVARLEDAVILQANEGMVDMTDLQKEELIGQRLGDLHLLARDTDLDDALGTLRRGERLHKLKSELRDAAGNAIDVLLSARSIELEGAPCGIFTFIEISDLERTRREHQQAQRELAHAHSRLAEQREQERVRLARELHDGVLQNLLAINTELALAERQYRTAGEEAAADLSRRCREHALHNATELRRMIRGFRPAALRDLGLWESLREALPDLRRPGGPKIVLPAEGEPDLPEETLLVLYRITQEALHNALRHAHASRVEVALELNEGGAVLRIEDDGRGFEVPARLSQLQREDHFGLIGMEERAATHGGRIEVTSAPGKGTRIVCHLPLASASGGGAPAGT